MPYKQILRQQQNWAEKRGIRAPAGYTESVDGNLFRPLHPYTLADFERGSGDELGKNGKRGKMQALHSSSALAVNVFDYWRDRQLAWLVDTLNLDSEPCSLRFEAQFPTGLRGTPPNLDLAFRLPGQRTLAVESKFTETYKHPTKPEPFNAAYFRKARELWSAVLLPRCQRLAERLDRGEERFQYLNAAQLLKHILGLRQPSVGSFTLLYLWYDISSEEASQHSGEVQAFSEEIDSDLDFRVLTYQKLFASMVRVVGPGHEAYLRYLGERYFAPVAAQ